MNGLSSSQVVELQKQYGKNDIQEHAESGFVRFVKRFTKPIPFMIEVALVLSVIAQHWEDFLVIAILLGINITIDILQEQKARKALDALKEKLAPIARVVRDNKLQTIDARELVPGDIVKLANGDTVPADAILLDNSFLEVDQSSVTGESLPVSKKTGDEVFVASGIHTGSAFVKITKTGKHSSLGTNARLIARAAQEKESHFQIAILKIGKFLIILSSVLIIFLLAVLITRGNPFFESIRFALVIAIASIPVALPAVLSVTMAIGASTLAKKRAVVSHFQSVEELAGADELCADKTGTITKNKLTVVSPIVYGDINEARLFTYALLAIDETRTSATEQAISEYAQEKRYVVPDTFVRVMFTPFNPALKQSEAQVRNKSGGDILTVIMGAPQTIHSEIGIDKQANIFLSDSKHLASEGLRVIAVVLKDKHGIKPVGLIPLTDPIRDDAKKTLDDLKNLGVRVHMLTGDNKATAETVARKLHINGKHTVKLPNELTDIEKTAVFAEIVPEDKYHIVEALQKREHIVAMTGDGINDAPALKKADVGIAVAGATPVARSAADIILLNDGLAVIQDSIHYARKVFARMQSYALFRISETIRVVIFITLAITAFNYSPISAIMLILLALLNDIPVMSIAYDNAAASDKPVRWHLRETIFIAAILGVTGVISSFVFLYWLDLHGFALATIQTLIFLKLDVAGHSTLYLTRSGRKHFWERPFPSLSFFIPAFSSRIAGTLIAMFGIFMQAISWQLVVYVWLYALVWFFVNDQVKILGYKMLEWIKHRNKYKSVSGS